MGAVKLDMDGNGSSLGTQAERKLSWNPG